MKLFYKAVILILFTVFLSGCAAAWLAGGAVGGYALAKNSENQRQAESKSFFK